jgi:hypothetical protein
MSVQPIGGAHPASAAQSLQLAAPPERAERAGTPDHDGDGDDQAVKVELSKQS